MKQTINLIGNTALSLISSTVIVLPFMIFFKLSNSHSAVSILPFVLFYTFRMTGIFFIRGIKTKLNSYTLLKIAIFSGLIGSLLGILGIYLPIFEVIAGIFLGLSAAWLPMANTTINYYKNENDLKSPRNVWFTLLFLILFGIVLLLPENYSYLGFFVTYAIMYAFALSTLTSIQKYKIKSHDLEDYSYPYLILFVAFFVLIFFLRSSRLLRDISQFTYFVYGALFLILFILAVEIFGHNKFQHLISRDLSYLTIINGSVGNYLFLFSSLYTTGYYGHEQLFAKFYLPYIFGIALAPKVSKLFGGKIKQNVLIGITIGLLLILLTPFFSIGILILSTFKSSLNNWLTQIYQQENKLPKDKRIWVKYTIQSIGSIMHQFLLMLTGSFLVIETQTSIKQFFVITNQKSPTFESKNLMMSWNKAATGILLVIIGIYIATSVYKIRKTNK